MKVTELIGHLSALQKPDAEVNGLFTISYNAETKEVYLYDEDVPKNLLPEEVEISEPEDEVEETEEVGF